MSLPLVVLDRLRHLIGDIQDVSVKRFIMFMFSHLNGYEHTTVGTKYSAIQFALLAKIWCDGIMLKLVISLFVCFVIITKTRPCNILQYFTAVKITNFRLIFLKIIFIYLLKT